MPLQHGAVDRTDFVRKHQHGLPDGNILQWHVFELRIGLAMSDRWHSLRERLEHRRSAANGILFQCLAARKHQHHQRAGQVFAQNDRGDNRDPGQQIGAELAPHELEKQLPHQRHSAQHECRVQGPSGRFFTDRQCKPQHQVGGNRHNHKHGNDELPAVDDPIRNHVARVLVSEMTSARMPS